MKPRLTRKFKIESAKKMSRFCILLAVSLTTLISGFSLLPIEVHAEEVEICGYDPMVSPAISFGDGKCVNEKYSCAKVSVSLASQFKAMALASIGIWTSGMNIETTVKTLYSCCVCEIPNEQPKKIGDARFTRESCEEACKKLSPPAHAYKQAGAGALDVAIKPPASATQSAKNKMMTCFTEKVCTGKEYGGTFKAGDGCPAGQGSCIAPEPVVKLSYPIGTVSTVQGYRGFVATIFQYILSIVATVAAVMFVWGGFRYIFGSAIGSIQSGKEIMIDSVVGLLLVLGAYTILQTINPQTLNLNKLEVKLIKRQLLLSETEFCKLDINYADAGDPPGTVDYNGASFDKGVQQTRCNYSYYPKDLGGEICMGT
ncbi:MAG: pilin, partial [Patescibacteria group bacterium]